MALIVGACGGDNTVSSHDGEGDSGNQDQGSPSGSKDEVETPEMPPAGEARFEVDGETFVFKQSEMLEGPFTCEIRDNGVSVNFQSDRHDLLLQGAVIREGKLIVSSTVAPENSDFKYSSSSAGGLGAAATEGSFLLYQGYFAASPKDDPGRFSEVGMGTVAVTCP